MKFIITNLENLAIRNLIFQKIPIIERKNDIFKVYSRNILYYNNCKTLERNKHMKTLYLHVGTTKTATTSIQRFLEENRNILQSHGYCFPNSLHRYPRANKRRNAHFLVAKVLDTDGTRNKQKEKEYFEEGLQQVRDAFQIYDNVILTDESIWYALSYLKKSLLLELKKEADEHKYQIKVIVYLRRQDELLLSRWNQEVKQNFTDAAIMTCEEYVATASKKQNKIYQYAQKLDEISAFIGKENVIVRRFAKKSWKDQSIIHDFMHEIGLDVTEEFQELKESENLRLDKNTTEIKRVLNKNKDFTQTEITYFRGFLKEITKDNIEEEKTEMLAKEELQQFLKQYSEENKRVAEEYIEDGKPLFSSEIKDLPKWNPQNKKMQEEMIQFFAAVAIDLKRENEFQKEQLKQQEKRIKDLEKKAKEFKVFQNKVRHPFRTILKRIFR